MSRLTIAVFASALLSAMSSSAVAGRTHLAWSYGSEINPESGTEIESWIWEQNKKGPANASDTLIWWGFVSAVGEHFQFAINTELDYLQTDMTEGRFGFARWGGDVRYRIQSPDRVDAGPLGTLLRFGVKRIVEKRAGVRLEADIVNSYEVGKFHATIDLGLIMERIEPKTYVELRPSGGVVYQVTDALRIGAEGAGEISITGARPTWYTVGPTISLTKGRFWGAANFGFGLTGISNAPRLTMGVAL